MRPSRDLNLGENAAASAPPGAIDHACVTSCATMIALGQPLTCRLLPLESCYPRGTPTNTPTGRDRVVYRVVHQSLFPWRKGVAERIGRVDAEDLQGVR